MASVIPTNPFENETGEFLTYEDAMAYLTGLTNHERVVPHKYSDVTFSLEGMKKLLEELGAPHEMPCAHIAGTKGKGSTSTILASILRNHGLKVGLFTKPHVLAWEERISINRTWINQEQMRKLISRIRPVVDRLKKTSRTASPTFFEALVALAWLHFQSELVDFAVMETGLGGRLDATNVASPVVCGISRIDYDHMKLLGDTLAKIAREKAGIIKEGIPVVSSAQEEEARDVIRARARELAAPMWFVGEEIEVERIRTMGTGVGFSVRSPWFEIRDLFLPLLGKHQALNAALAIALSKFVSEASGFPLEEEAVRRGLRQTRLMARVEVVSSRPLVVIDGGHNAAAARALMSALRGSLSYERCVIVLGMMKDKDIPAALKELSGADHIVATAVDYPRAMPPSELAELARTHTEADVTDVAEPMKALESALSLARPTDLVCVTGSLYLAGEVRPLFP